jgi:hypothetical protein
MQGLGGPWQVGGARSGSAASQRGASWAAHRTPVFWLASSSAERPELEAARVVQSAARVEAKAPPLYR